MATLPPSEPRFAPLFEPLRLGPYTLSHRVVMAPLTRMRATVPGNAPNALNAQYYGQRATPGGLIIAEASQVLATGQGMPATPGIHSREQVEGWKGVVDAIHARADACSCSCGTWGASRTRRTSRAGRCRSRRRRSRRRATR